MAQGPITPPQTAPPAEEKPKQDEVAKEEAHSAAPATDLRESPPEPGTTCLKYIGLSATYKGPLRGSHKELTDTQLRQAGIKDAFKGKTVVRWSPLNGYLVPKEDFSDEAYKRLLKEDDLEEAVAE